MIKLFKALGTIAVLAVLLSFAGCDISPKDEVYDPAVYTGSHTDGTLYVLIITGARAVIKPAAGDSYTLTIESQAGTTKTSYGTVQSFSNNQFTLKANNSSEPFVVKVSSGSITGITGTITLDGGGTTTGPGNLTPAPAFVAVTDITGVPTGILKNTSITLSGTVEPSDATNKTIVWTVKSAGTTGAAISGNTLTTTEPGDITVTATIANGKTATTSYTQDFPIKVVNEFVAVTGITGVPEYAKADTPLTLTGTVAPTDATNTTIVWSVKSAGTTGAAISGNTLSTTASGTVTLTATIAYGKTATTSYTQDFPIGVTQSFTFSTIAAFDDWLSTQPKNKPETAYNVALNISSLGTSTNYNNGVLETLYNNQTKYVSLDLSGSTFTSIEMAAFNDSQTLTGVTIGDKVTSIGESAFSSCRNLKSVTIGKSVASIGESAFGYCTSLTAINVASDNSTYTSEDGVLYNKNKITLICYPGGKTGSFTIPEGVTRIGNNAFASSSLTEVTMGNKVEIIEDYAFSWCKSLTKVTITENVSFIGAGAFNGCESLTKVTIGDKVTSIGESAFSWCESLKSVTIGKSVTDIGQWAFAGCNSLENVTIPKEVTRIEAAAFYDCTSLTSVTFECDIDEAGFSNGDYYYYGDNTYNYPTFPGDLRDKYLNDGGGTGTYTRQSGSDDWKKQV